MKQALIITAASALLLTLTACGGGSTSSSKPASTPSRTAAAKAHAAKASATPKKSASAKASPSPKAKPATAETKNKAAAILKKEDADFRTFLAKGQKTVGTPDFTAWYQKAILGLDMQQDAFNKADGLFTADNEPTALIEAWRSDSGDANAAITQYGVDGTHPDAPNAKTKKDATDALAALAKADKDAERIAKS